MWGQTLSFTASVPMTAIRTRKKIQKSQKYGLIRKHGTSLANIRLVEVRVYLFGSKISRGSKDLHVFIDTRLCTDYGLQITLIRT